MLLAGAPCSVALEQPASAREGEGEREAKQRERARELAGWPTYEGGLRARELSTQSSSTRARAAEGTGSKHWMKLALTATVPAAQSLAGHWLNHQGTV